jgi:hypothetical protein
MNIHVPGAKLLDFVFSNFTDLYIIHDVHLPASPDTYRPTFATEKLLPLRKSNHPPKISFRKYCFGDFTQCYTKHFPSTTGLLTTMRPQLMQSMADSLF